MESEALLVRRASLGDREAFEELVRLTARSVYVRVYMEVGNVADSEDLVQETFMRAFRSIKKVTKPEGFRPWLYTIARTAVVDFQRKSMRKKRWGLRRQCPEVLDRLPAADRGADSLSQEEKRERVRQAMQSLPEAYRMPLMLRYLEGADYQRISEQMGVTNGSVRGLLHRGLKVLGELLGKEAFSYRGV